MTTTYTEAVKAIGNKLKEIRGLRVLDQPEDVLPEFPVAVFIQGPTPIKPWELHGANGQRYQFELELRVYVSKIEALERWAELNAFMDHTGEKSIIKKMSEDVTFGGKVAGALVTAINRPSVDEWASIPYLGAIFSVRVQI